MKRFAILLIGPVVVGSLHADWVGYRGPNGTGVFPASNPPVRCDEKTGSNILWRAPLPNWSHGAPTIVKGRAFVLSEAGWKHDGPVLTCVDAAPAVAKPAATLSCYDLAGKELGASHFHMSEPTAEKQAQTRSQVGWDRWGFGYGMPFTIHGDRLYLRSSDELICVEEK